MALSNGDKKYIRENYVSLTDKELAKILRCTTQTIQNFRNKFGLRKKGPESEGYDKALKLKGRPFEMLTPPEQSTYAKAQLKRATYYSKLKEMFNTHELNTFLDTWAKYYIQFRGEITPTEVTQVCQLIQYEIMMDRVLIQKRNLIDTADKLREVSEIEKSSPSRDMDKIFMLEREIRDCNSLQSQMTKEFNDLQTRHKTILENLKATRDQRIERIEGQTKNFFALVKYIQNVENQKREARYMELGRLAATGEKNRFEQLHTFQDGSVDRIFLTPDSMEREDEVCPEEQPSLPE